MKPRASIPAMRSTSSERRRELLERRGKSLAIEQQGVKSRNWIPGFGKSGSFG
jgi:hypothetical protein